MNGSTQGEVNLLVTPIAVPEPSTLALGAVAYAVIVRRRRAQPAIPEPAAKRRAELEKLLEEK